MKIVKNDKKFLRQKSESVSDRVEARELANQLLDVVRIHNQKIHKAAKRGIKGIGSYAIGLAAPQLGILKRACVVLTGDSPLVLINPEIVRWGHVRVPWQESCLSFPGKSWQTYRWPWVQVSSDNHPYTLSFGPLNPDQWSRESLLHAVCAQHEIAHLYGLLCEDFASEDYPEPTFWKDWSP